jgi:hypothetical protein
MLPVNKSVFHGIRKEVHGAAQGCNGILSGNTDCLKRANQSKGWDAKPLA